MKWRKVQRVVSVEDYPYKKRVEEAYQPNRAFLNKLLDSNARIYIPFERPEPIQATDILTAEDKDVISHLTYYQYTDIDYAAGLCTSPAKRRIKIVKALGTISQKLLNEIYFGKHADIKSMAAEVKETLIRDALTNKSMDIEHLKSTTERYVNSFINSLARSASKVCNFMIAISQDPHDIAKMSYKRGWTSCINLEGGCNADKLYKELTNGGLVAYLIRDNDPNIEHPFARLWIRRFENSNGESFLMPEKNVYGTTLPGFVDAVKNWIASFQSPVSGGIYYRQGSDYSDTFGEVLCEGMKDITSTIHLLRSLTDKKDRCYALRHLVDNAWGFEYQDKVFFDAGGTREELEKIGIEAFDANNNPRDTNCRMYNILSSNIHSWIPATKIADIDILHLHTVFGIRGSSGLKDRLSEIMPLLTAKTKKTFGDHKWLAKQVELAESNYSNSSPENRWWDACSCDLGLNKFEIIIGNIYRQDDSFISSYIKAFLSSFRRGLNKLFQAKISTIQDNHSLQAARKRISEFYCTLMNTINNYRFRHVLTIPIITDAIESVLAIADPAIRKEMTEKIKNCLSRHRMVNSQIDQRHKFYATIRKRLLRKRPAGKILSSLERYVDEIVEADRVSIERIEKEKKERESRGNTVYFSDPEDMCDVYHDGYGRARYDPYYDYYN